MIMTKLKKQIEKKDILAPKIYEQSRKQIRKELVATLMFEIDDPKIRADFLGKVGGIEEKVYLKIGKDKIRAKPEIDGGVTVHNACHARAQNMGIKARDMLKFIPNIKLDVVERCAGHGGTFGVMKETHDLAVKVGTPTARQIKNKNNKYMASDCPLAGKHLKQLETDTNIANDEALHPIELMAKSYRL